MPGYKKIHPIFPVTKCKCGRFVGIGRRHTCVNCGKIKCETCAEFNLEMQRWMCKQICVVPTDELWFRTWDDSKTDFKKRDFQSPLFLNYCNSIIQNENIKRLNVFHIVFQGAGFDPFAEYGFYTLIKNKLLAINSNMNIFLHLIDSQYRFTHRIPVNLNRNFSVMSDLTNIHFYTSLWDSLKFISNFDDETNPNPDIVSNNILMVGLNGQYMRFADMALARHSGIETRCPNLATARRLSCRCQSIFEPYLAFLCLTKSSNYHHLEHKNFCSEVETMTIYNWSDEFRRILMNPLPGSGQWTMS